MRSPRRRRQDRATRSSAPALGAASWVVRFSGPPQRPPCSSLTLFSAAHSTHGLVVGWVSSGVSRHTLGPSQRAVHRDTSSPLDRRTLRLRQARAAPALTGVKPLVRRRAFHDLQRGHAVRSGHRSSTLGTVHRSASASGDHLPGGRSLFARRSPQGRPNSSVRGRFTSWRQGPFAARSLSLRLSLDPTGHQTGTVGSNRSKQVG